MVLESNPQSQANLASRCDSLLVVAFDQLAEPGIVFEVAIATSRENTGQAQ